MGRECRRVPADWVHPKNPDGRYQPKHDRDYETEACEWFDGACQWDNGEHPDQVDKDYEVEEYKFYWEWCGPPPEEDYYFPKWVPETRTHYQMYESTSEGTPISPVMETPEELARWLVDNNASAFADITATYDEWLGIAKGGWAPSAVMTVSPDGSASMVSGVEAMGDQTP